VDLTLHTYQEQAVVELVQTYDDAAHASRRRGKSTAIALTAPTGAGKTVIAAAFIERLLVGDGENVGANPDLAVLWLSDSPDLNQQTLDKLKVATDKVTGTVVDEQFDEPYFPPGQVYFINTQKLGGGAKTYRAGGARRYGLWDTIAGSVARYGPSFLVIIDEAHRGTGVTTGNPETILGQVLSGGANLRTPPGVVLGISATQERFRKLVGSSRTWEPVIVEAADVRASGLVKDDLPIGRTTDDQEGDVTLLAEATARLAVMRESWASFTTANEEQPVEPALVVQLPASVAAAKVAQYIDVIRETDPTITPDNIAHCLQEHRPEVFGQYTIPYVPPTAIQSDTRIRVVLFKEALTTGWDCPRAEVMISLRSASDPTYITQLIGRMVRNPLARRIESRADLNAVWVYLPHFNKDAVNSVVARLREGDDAITVAPVLEPVTTVRNPNVPDSVWAAFRGFPTYTRPTKVAKNAVDRAIKLGMLFQEVGGLKASESLVRTSVTAAARAALARHAQAVQAKAQTYSRIDFEVQWVDYLTGEVTETSDGFRETVVRNIDDLYASAQRRMFGAPAKWLWNELCDEMDPEDAKLTVAALSTLPDIKADITAAAEALIRSWLKEHQWRVSEQGGEMVARLNGILETSPRPEPTPVIEPSPREVADQELRLPLHLIAAAPGQACPAGLYPVKFGSSWEERAIASALNGDGVLGWYRNPPNGAASVRIPWWPPEDPQNVGLLAPDLLVFRDVPDRGVVVDILDPHDPTREDTIGKWRALARFAVEHGDRLGRVWAIVVGADKRLLFLDLRRQAVVAALNTDGVDVRRLFEQEGGRLPEQ